MPLLLRPAKEDDSTKIGAIGRDAFSGTLSRSIFPPHLHSKSETGDPGLDEAQWRAARNLRRMREGKPTYVVVDVPEDGSGDERVVGFAQWELPSQETPSTAGAAVEIEPDPLPASLDQEKLLEMYRLIEDETKKALGPEGYSNMWYLMSVAIDPTQQRRGIGRMLVQHGLDQAAKAGKDAFLISTPEGRGLYYALGFRDVTEPITLGPTPHSLMIWKNPETGVH
ncbi:puromycin N-acetyltransferase [Parachaetomium inaequale]|uniref:Puromycin N-acetyltransferase n=1 Tax=Parachaetomium inaequale TaxID=2588326 RepID=A0AAN6PB61_9PEZI|nr:puromycin N-acetyltransferase [Parachaetomium inaequale]